MKVLNRYQGPLAIHVSKKSPGWEKAADYLRERFALSDADLATPFPVDGCIIGVCVAGPTKRWAKEPIPDVLCDVAVFEDLLGRYLTPIYNPRWLTKPIPAKGSLGLWSYSGAL